MAHKEYVLKAAHLFSGVILNANIVEGFPGVSASLAVALGGKPERVSYWVEPYTYTFGKASRT